MFNIKYKIKYKTITFTVDRDETKIKDFILACIFVKKRVAQFSCRER